MLPFVWGACGTDDLRISRLVLVLAAAVGACAAPRKPYVRYDGGHAGRTPKPVDDMEVLRAGPPPARYHDLGTVIVTCPSETSVMPGPFGMARGAQVGGCHYSWAVRQACERASEAGADGIHSIETATNSAGAVVSLRASVFVHLPKLVVPPPPSRRRRSQSRPRRNGCSSWTS